MNALRIAFLLLFTLSCAPAARPPASSQHPHGRHVGVAGKRIWVEERGSGEPLVLIPGGGGGSHDYYHPYFDALSRSFRVIYYDGFGRGRSERAAQRAEYSFDRDIEEVEALRRALGLGKVHVLGHSYAGLVAEGYALRYPDSVNRLVLLCSFTSGADWQESNEHVNETIKHQFPEAWSRIEQLRAKGLMSSAPEMQKAYYGHFDRMLAMIYFYNPIQASLLSMTAENFNPDAYYQLVGDDGDFVLGGDMAKVDFNAELQRLRMPVLVGMGRFDGIVTPRLSGRVARAIPHATVVTFEKSGHFPFIEENEKVLEVLRRFLAPGGGAAGTPAASSRAPL